MQDRYIRCTCKYIWFNVFVCVKPSEAFVLLNCALMVSTCITTAEVFFSPLFLCCPGCCCVSAVFLGIHNSSAVFGECAQDQIFRCNSAAVKEMLLAEDVQSGAGCALNCLLYIWTCVGWRKDSYN